MAAGTSVVTSKVAPGPGEYILVHVTGVLSTNETLTVSELGTIKGAMLYNEADNLVDTCTVATNVITLTQSTITDNTYTGFAWGTV
jgi:uncharacterized membrane protein